jgi:hypothetical protein
MGWLKTLGMPRKPTPLIVEVVHNQDRGAARAARKDVLKLLIRFILEDRGEAIPDSLPQAREA